MADAVACASCLSWQRGAPGRCHQHSHPAYAEYGCPDWTRGTALSRALLRLAEGRRAEAATLEAMAHAIR